MSLADHIDSEAPNPLEDRRSARRFRLAILAIWVVEAVLAVLLVRGNIASGRMPDGDDFLRLQQVRDLLNGQSWFDLFQHRFVPPVAAPMHWSRLVDVPIAAVILMLRPLVGQASAETAAAVFVPLLTMGCTIALVAHISRRVIGARLALLAAAAVPFVPLAWVQLQPLRIDHHGWQIVAALAIAAALLDRSSLRAGIIAATASAAWLTISLEGLPFVLAAGAAQMFPWLRSGEDGVRARSFAVALAAIAGLLFIATHAGSELFVVRCDTLTSPYVAALATVGLIVMAASLLPGGLALRLIAATIAAVAGLAVFLWIGPACTTGPFAQLDPMVYKIWFRNVPEGAPLWRQSLPVGAMIVATPLLGLAGSAIGLSRAPAERRIDWGLLIWLQCASLLIAIAVQRAGAVANVLALPGAMLLLSVLFRAARALSRPVSRVLATVAVVIIMFPPAVPAILIAATNEPDKADKPEPDCSSPAAVRPLASLRPGNVLSTLDLSSVIIATTPQLVLATGHHRNDAGMRDVITAFTSSDAKAREVIARRRIDYVVICPTASESRLLVRLAPRGFAQALISGRAPGWLHPVVLQRDALLIWKVARPATQ